MVTSSSTSYKLIAILSIILNFDKLMNTNELISFTHQDIFKICCQEVDIVILYDVL